MKRRAAAAENMQLSLFDLAAPAQSEPLAAPAPPRADLAPAAAPPPQQALAPAVFRHPQADREIRLQQHLVAYALKRVRRRSIGFIVDMLADGPHTCHHGCQIMLLL